MSNVETSRGSFFVRDTGGSGDPILFLHGWPENSACWDPILSNIQGKARFIRPDLRGMGQSNRALEFEKYQKQELAKDIIALLDHLKVENFGIVAHDWGAGVSQEMAFLIPQRVRKMMLMNIPILCNAKGFAKARATHSASPINALWYQAFMMSPGLPEAVMPGKEEAWLTQLLKMGSPRAKISEELVREYAKTYQLPGSATTGANYYRALGLDGKNWAKLFGRKIKPPTLLLYGKNDPVVIQDYLEGVEDCFDSLELKIVDSGHFMPEENPGLVAEEVTRYFSDLLVG